MTAPVSTIGLILAAEQIVWLGGVATAFGVGFTRTVAVIDAPTQLFAVGVIVKVTVIGALVVFVSAPEISPVPLAAMPVTELVLSRVQSYVVPLTAPEITIVEIEAAEQIVWFGGVATAFGFGLTKTVAVIAAPGQPLAVGVIVKVTVTGALVVLVSDPVMSPLPEAAMPVTDAVLSLVHAYAVPVTAPVKDIGEITASEQIVWLDGVAIAVGVGLTVMVNEIGVPVQPEAVTKIPNATGLVPTPMFATALVAVFITDTL